MVKHSTFSLGKFGFLVNGICLCWIAFAVVLFSFPVSLPVTAASMNYASVVFAGYVNYLNLGGFVHSLTGTRFACISIGWYFIRGRKHFHGPPVVQDAEPTLRGQAVAEDSEKGLEFEAPPKGK